MKPRWLRHYILDGDNNTVAVDLLTWAAWFEDANRHVDFGGMFMITRSADGAGKLGPFDSAATYIPMHSFAGLLGSGMFN